MSGIINGEASIAAGDAINYHNRGMEQLGNVLYGEEHAKEAVLASLVLGSDLILSGLPGGGKSTLARNAHHLVSDIPREDVVLVPAQHDIKATQLVGGRIVTRTDIDEDGEKTVETATREIDGIITPSTKVIRIDELNRVNPLALQALLPVLETGELETTQGVQRLANLVMLVATQNPSESRQSTFTVSDAMASRFTAGALMGEKGTREERLALDRAVRKFTPEPIEPVVSLAGIQALRKYAIATAVDPAMEDKISRSAINVADSLLGDYKIAETDRRIGMQIEKNAKTLGAIRTKEHVVTEQDLVDAVRMVFAARLGALKRTNGQSLDAHVNAAVNG